MIESLKSCDICGAESDVLNVNATGKLVCGKCMIVYDPPKMTLATYTIDDKIWNYEAGMYDVVQDILAFGLCRWSIRSTQETHYKICPRVKVTNYYLEYEGAVKCCRCLEYPYWPEDWGMCMAEICIPFMTRKEPEDIKWPREGRSRYYELRKRF